MLGFLLLGLHPRNLFCIFAIMKVRVLAMYEYGGWANVRFTKTFDMPCAPFLGMSIYEHQDGYDNNLELKEYDNIFSCVRVHIMFSPDEPDVDFIVEVIELWKRPVPDNNVDHAVDIYPRLGWEAHKRNDPEAMKELMQRARERNNR